MRAHKAFIALMAAGSLALGTGTALASSDTATAPEGSKPAAAPAAKKAEVHRVRGEVTSVEPGAKTMVVKVMEGKKEMTVGVDVNDKTVIRRGRAHKTLADIKVGDRVWMKYDRESDKLVAEQIRILRTAHVAAKQ